MLPENFLRDARERFAILGPPVSEAEILAVFPVPFWGREDLVQFYLHNNGGSRTSTGGAYACGNPEHRVSRNHLEKMRVEGFFSIQRSVEERVPALRPMLKYHALMSDRLKHNPEMKLFLENHMPVAFDHSGNDIWIDFRDGGFHFMDWQAYREGPVKIALSFREFVDKFWTNAPISEAK